MSVFCPECGGASRDHEICERCNTDLKPASVPVIAGSRTAPSPDVLAGQVSRLSRPEAAVVVGSDEHRWRCHWIRADAWPAWQPRVEQRLAQSAAALPPCRVLPADRGVWVVAEVAGARPKPWTDWPGPDLRTGLDRLAAFAAALARALEELHAAGLVWLNFDPLALEEVGGRLRFTNLDLAVFPAAHLPAEPVSRSSIAAPEIARAQAEAVGPRSDVFHLALYVYYTIGRFLPHGFFGQGLAAFDFEVPPVRVFEPRLPVGIAPVVHRGLAADPARRPATPSAWCTEFRAAVEQAEARDRGERCVAWDSGFHTRVGRAKSALARPNEDAGFVRHYASPERTVVAIADGVSCCDVGTGETASQIVCRRLEAFLGPGVYGEEFFLRAGEACVLAAGDILDWALRRGDNERLASGANLMGTTALAAWLEGRALRVANVGDSRAYLIDDSGLEQLTVDGDLGNALLAAGVPPEELKDLGRAARSLYSFVGGCCRDADGTPHAGEQGQPVQSLFSLLPRDTIVLCSDGLVEEGAFLEPDDLLRLVREHADLSAQALAEKLADAADARQHLPSEAEPEGRGDNITCCVIRVTEMRAEG